MSWRSEAILFIILLFQPVMMYTRLLLPVVFMVLECLLCIRCVAGYFIHIDAHAEECFFDRVTSGTKLSLMFEVAEGGFLDIDVKVRVGARLNKVHGNLNITTNLCLLL